MIYAWSNAVIKDEFYKKNTKYLVNKTPVTSNSV